MNCFVWSYPFWWKKAAIMVWRNPKQIEAKTQFESSFYHSFIVSLSVIYKIVNVLNSCDISSWWQLPENATAGYDCIITSTHFHQYHSKRKKDTKKIKFQWVFLVFTQSVAPQQLHLYLWCVIHCRWTIWHLSAMLRLQNQSRWPLL